MSARTPKNSKALLPWVIAAFLAVCFSIAGLLFLFQHVASFQFSLIVTVLSVVVFTPLLRLVMVRYIQPRLTRLPSNARLAVLSFALIGGSLLILRAPGGILSDTTTKLYANLQNPYIRRLLVQPEMLEITISGDRNAKSTGAAVELFYITTDNGDVSFLAFSYDGEWERRSSSLYTSGENPAALTWVGRPGRNMKAVFRSSPTSGIVSLTRDGAVQQVDLYASADGEVAVDLEFPIRSQLMVQVMLIVALSLAASFIMLNLMLALPVDNKQLAAQQVFVSLFFLVYLIIGAWVYQDYGIPTDENTQRQHGLVSAKYIIQKIDPQYESPLFEELPDLESYPSKNYGVALNLPLALFEIFTDFSDTRTLYLFRHYVIFLFFFVGTLAFFKLAAERFADWRIGLLGTAFFILTPRIFADSFFNIKDTAFLAAFTIAMYFGFRFWRKPNISNALWFGFFAAFATNIRIITVMLVALVIIYAVIHRGRPMRQAWLAYVVLLTAYTAFLVMLFPASWNDPIKTIGETLLVFSNFERFTGSTLFRGVSILGQYVPPEYLPVWIAITTPMLYLSGFVVGTIAALIHGIKALRSRSNPILHEDLVFLALALVPVLAAIILGSTLYNGWRHFFFIYAPFMLVALTGLTFIWQEGLPALKPHLRQVGIIFLVLWVGGTLVNNARWMVVNHPFQNVFYNPILVQLFGGREGFDRDYWGLSIRQGLEYILAIDDRESIPVQIDGNAQTRGFILKKEERERIVYIDNPQQKVDYYIGVYSVHNKYYRYDPSYSIVVDGLPILTIYADPTLHENQ